MTPQNDAASLILAINPVLAVNSDERVVDKSDPRLVLCNVLHHFLRRNAPGALPCIKAKVAPAVQHIAP